MYSLDNVDNSGRSLTMYSWLYLNRFFSTMIVLLLIGYQASADPPRFTEYMSYIAYEVKQAQPARVQCIYERALQDNCLLPDLWLQYTTYLVRLTILGTVFDLISEHALISEHPLFFFFFLYFFFFFEREILSSL